MKHSRELSLPLQKLKKLFTQIVMRIYYAFVKNSEEKFEPSYSFSCNKRLISFRHDLFDNFNKNCRFYIIISGSESDKWMERLSDPLYAEFSQYSDEHETRIDCFKEGKAGSESD